MPPISTITINLQSATDLLADPASDSEHSGPSLSTGLDEILTAVAPIPENHDLQLVLRLPREEITGAVTPNMIENALISQCAEHIDNYEGAMAGIRQEGTGRLLTNLFIVAGVVTTLGFVLFTVESIAFLRGALGGLLALGVWVVLRHPLALYLHQWRPYKHAIARCRQVMAASLRVELY